MLSLRGRERWGLLPPAGPGAPLRVPWAAVKSAPARAAAPGAGSPGAGGGGGGRPRAASPETPSQLSTLSMQPNPLCLLGFTGSAKQQASAVRLTTRSS